MSVLPVRLHVVGIVLAIFLTGCATSYGPLGPRGGYSETRLSEDEFLVSFRGNPLLAPEKAREYCLIRCAELTLENGGKYFIIWADSSVIEIKENRATREQPWQTGGTSINQATATADISVDTQQAWTVGRLHIQIYPEPDPVHRYAQLDAREILAAHGRLPED